MEKVKPFVSCNDYWPVKIPHRKLMAYRMMKDEGQIQNLRITFNKNTGATMMSYVANQPHEWVLEQLKALAEEV